MTDIPACPQCAGENTYPDGDNFICADCAFEWPIAADALAGEPGLRVRDSNSNELADGEHVVVIKDLKVKGSSNPLTQGTMIRAIRMGEDDAEHIEGNYERTTGLVLKTGFWHKQRSKPIGTPEEED